MGRKKNAAEKSYQDYPARERFKLAMYGTHFQNHPEIVHFVDSCCRPLAVVEDGNSFLADWARANKENLEKWMSDTFKAEVLNAIHSKDGSFFRHLAEIIENWPSTLATASDPVRLWLSGQRSFDLANWDSERYSKQEQECAALDKEGNEATSIEERNRLFRMADQMREAIQREKDGKWRQLESTAWQLCQRLKKETGRECDERQMRRYLKDMGYTTNQGKIGPPPKRK